MPLGDITEQNAVLDALFGAGHAASMPSSHDLALFTGNPYAGGVEITGPGYARVTITNGSAWPAAVDGAKTTTATFPDPTDAWDDAACWVLFNGTAITAWEFLDGTLEVDGPGSDTAVDVTVYVPNDNNVSA